jgi:hypothetical protein
MSSRTEMMFTFEVWSSIKKPLKTLTPILRVNSHPGALYSTAENTSIIPSKHLNYHVIVNPRHLLRQPRGRCSFSWNAPGRPCLQRDPTPAMLPTYRWRDRRCVMRGSYVNFLASEEGFRLMIVFIVTEPAGSVV